MLVRPSHRSKTVTSSELREPATYCVRQAGSRVDLVAASQARSRDRRRTEGERVGPADREALPRSPHNR
jgi:hypothetical protein